MGKEKWNRTSIQFPGEEYDRLWREHAETRQPIAQIIRSAPNFYFENDGRSRTKKDISHKKEKK